MTQSSRRGFLTGAIATVAAPALGGAETAAAATFITPARRRTVRLGRAIAVAPKGGRLLVAHARRRTVAIVGGGRRRFVDVGGQPLEVAVSPDGRLGAVTTASWDEPGLAIIDLRSGRRRRLEAGPAPFGVAFSPDGRRLIVSGGEQEGEVRIVDVRSLRTLARESVGTCPRAITIAPGSDQAWVAVNGLGQVVGVDLASARIQRTLRTPALPDRVAVSADGRRLLVAHGGSDAERVSEIEIAGGRLKRRRVGRQPSGVAWGPRGRRLVALGGAGEIVAISATGRRIHRVGGAPRGLAVAGNRAWTADALSGAIRRVNLT